MANQKIPELSQIINYSNIPYGYCHCGCGQKTSLAPQTDKGRGYIKGRPVKYIIGHNGRGRLGSKSTRFTHGMSRTSIYRVWHDMIRRCEKSVRVAYKYYGGRGIKVCERWHSFENFYADVGNPPKDKTLDRWPDKDGDYKPTNWRWATRKEQAANTRNLFWFFAFNLNTGEWDEDNNQHEFARRHAVGQQGISACLHGKVKTHKGWTFCRT